MTALASGPVQELVQIAPATQSWNHRSLSALIEDFPDRALADMYRRTRLVFDEIAERKLPRWVVTFSGGKDSTLTALLAVDYISELPTPPNLSVVYSDTLLEIPAMRVAAEEMLVHLRRVGKARKLPIQVHVVRPAVENTYWVRMLGRGYPPPKPKFRWCTRRLKIEPAAPFVTSGEPTAVLTGVRYGESAGRTARLHATCATGGECGQDYWASKGPQGSGVTYFAPIVHWTTCKVWDFLHMIAPEAGWPTQTVYALYGDSSLRFGCWTCTLVRRDRTIEALIERDQDATLRELHAFREFMWAESRVPKNRQVRNGHLAALTPEFRRELLDQLLALQSRVGKRLITAEEVTTIRRLWRNPNPPGSPNPQPSASGGLPGTTIRQQTWS